MIKIKSKKLRLERETMRVLTDLSRVVGGHTDTEARTECFPSGIHTCAIECPIPTFAPCPRPNVGG